MHRILTQTAVALATLSAMMASAGDLSPPGAPSGQMLPLDQVEPRTPITAIPMTITQEGSYFLTGNLTGVSGQSGITVDADNVTIDLRGFTLIGVTGSDDGIVINSGHRGVVIRNGTVRDWDEDGIDGNDSGTITEDCAFENLRLIDNAEFGLRTGDDSVVVDCVADGNSTGFGLANSCTMERCTASDNTTDGVLAGFSASIRGCTARENGGDGFSLDLGSVIRDCTAAVNGIDGIQVLGNCLVRNNACDTNGIAGIRAIEDGNLIDSNVVANHDGSGDAGVLIPDSPANEDNLVIRNMSFNNTTPFSINTSNNTSGPVIIGNGTLGGTTDHPWANFAPDL